jgi:hypothetical protein
MQICFVAERHYNQQNQKISITIWTFSNSIFHSLPCCSFNPSCDLERFDSFIILWHQQLISSSKFTTSQFPIWLGSLFYYAWESENLRMQFGMTISIAKISFHIHSHSHSHHQSQSQSR